MNVETPSLTPTLPPYRAPSWARRESEVPASGSERSRQVARGARLALTDLELLHAVVLGDALAFEVFYERFKSLMIACITRVGVRAGARFQRHDLADVLGDACLNMVAHDFRRLRLYRVDGGCSVSSWVGVIASSTAHDFLRKERRRRADPMSDSELERLAPAIDGPDHGVLGRERRAFVDEALAGFSRRDRRFVHLYFVEALTPEAIADEMGVSVSTVYSKKAKIKTRLRAMVMAAA